MKHYRITSGSFRMPDGTLKTAGEEIELASDVAASHADKLEELQPADPQPTADAQATATPQE